MSFFGIDNQSSQYEQQRKDSQVYDFQDTYDGLGEFDTEDALNSETFGVGEVGKNFDFSATAVNSASSAATRPNLSFARAAAANDDDFMKDLWGDSTPEPAASRSQPPNTLGQVPAPVQGAAGMNGDRKILSLQEIEAQLTAIDQSHPQGHMPPQQQFYPGMPSHLGGYMVPQGYMPTAGQYGMPFPGQFMPMQAPFPGHYPQQGMPGMPMPPVVGAPNAQSLSREPQQQQPAPPPASMAYPVQPNQQPPTTVPTASVEHAPIPAPVPHLTRQSAPESITGGSSARDMSQFPVLGSKEQSVSSKETQTQTQRPAKSFAHAHTSSPSQSQFSRHQVPHEDLSPEEQQRLARRHEKFSKIMRHSGVMNPKDKDFVTRFQLSQIVTDDPYNEDFYAQVYKVIHPKSAPDALGKPASDQANSIAQAYLDQSGHRLGGRYRRADVALHRMQQQVQKAVTVAKERQKLSRTSKEGVLGKISVGSGKKPRQQLVILSKAAQKAKENEGAEESNITQKKESSPSIAAPAKPIKKYSKKDIMRILEEIINNLMTVESNSRLTADVDTTELWESLHVLDQSSSSGDDESFVNPFIQCLNYAKALKILPRLFKFLTREQVLTVVTLVTSNLENLKVIKDGSYTTYPDKKVPTEILALVETYSLTFCKVLMNAVQDFRFNEIIGLLFILIQHNSVSFVSTTKIGLSVLTTLLSRAELMRGEGSISATDLSEWTSCYDELFAALESRISAIFPPTHGDTEDDYVWQFLATLSLGGKLSHQRIIVDEVRDEIFGVMNRAKAIDNNDMANLYKKQSMLNNLNMYLVVMGLVADENEIQELKT